jgi:hypothetical protein
MHKTEAQNQGKSSIYPDFVPHEVESLFGLMGKGPMCALEMEHLLTVPIFPLWKG